MPVNKRIYSIYMVLKMCNRKQELYRIDFYVGLHKLNYLLQYFLFVACIVYSELLNDIHIEYDIHIE